MFIPPQSDLQVFNNINYDINNRDVRLFNNGTQRDAHFDSLTPYVVGANFQHIRDSNAISCGGGFNRLQYANYCRYRNKEYLPWIYAFVINVEYINENMSRLQLVVDDFQTWHYEVDYYKCLVERAHIREYRGNMPYAFEQSLETEGLEFGGEYDNVHTEHIDLTDSHILIASTLSLTKGGGTVENPIINGADGGTYDKCPSMLTYYIVQNLEPSESGLTDSINYICNKLQGYPWVARGIQFMTIIPKAVLQGYQDNISYVTSEMGFKIGEVKQHALTGNGFSYQFNDFKKWYNAEDTTTKPRCGKMLMFPYTWLEVTSYNGVQLVLKNENVPSDNLYSQILGFISANPRLVLTFIDYNNSYIFDNGLADTDILPNDITRGDFLDFAMIIADFPQFPVAIDNYTLTMAEKANRTALAHEQNEIAYNRRQRGAVMSGIGAITNLASANFVGGAVNQAIGAVQESLYASTDYRMATEAILAQQNDAKLIPPTIQGQSGGDGFNLSKGITGFVFKWKRIKKAHWDKIQNYFIRFGYLINKFDHPNNYFRLNEELNYIKTVGCVVGGNVPVQAKKNLERIFDNGVTLWHKNTIGDYGQNENR